MRLCFGLVFFLMLIGLEAQAADWLQDSVVQETLKTNQSRSKTAGFFDEHQLILFYSSHCPHCHQFAPVLKRWAKNNIAKVLPIAFDNQPLAEFQQFIPATKDLVNMAFQGNPIQYPALFVASSKNKALYPVGFGAMSLDELENRMRSLIPKISSYEESL